MIYSFSSFESFLFYVAFFAVTSSLMVFSTNLGKQFSLNSVNKKRRAFSLFLVVLFCLPIIWLLASRVNVGRDYLNYSTIYSDYLSDYRGNTEIGILFLFKLSKVSGLGYRGFLFFCSVLSFCLIAIAIYQFNLGKYYPFALFAFLCMLFGPLCNIMGQMIALSFCTFSMLFVFKRKYLFSVLFLVIASLFHSSSIMVLIFDLVYLLVRKNKYRIVVVSFLLLIVSSFFAIYPNGLKTLLELFGINRYGSYFSSTMLKTPMIILIYHLPLYVFEFFTVGRSIIKENNRFVFLLILFEIFSLIVGIGVLWAFRLHYFFTIGHVLYVCNWLSDNKDKKQMTTFVVFVGCVYFILLFGLEFFYSGYDSISKYSFIL